MPTKDKKLSKLLADLKSEYLKDLPGKISRLKNVTETENWTQIYEECHKLKGTGKTYGFPEISQVCQVLEDFAQKKETQKITLFKQAVALLKEMNKDYAKGKTLDLSKHPFGKTLLHARKTK